MCPTHKPHAMYIYLKNGVNFHAFLSSAWNWDKWSASQSSHFNLSQKSHPPQKRRLARPQSQSGHGSEYAEKEELKSGVELCGAWIISNLKIIDHTWTNICYNANHTLYLLTLPGADFPKHLIIIQLLRKLSIMECDSSSLSPWNSVKVPYLNPVQHNLVLAAH